MITDAQDKHEQEQAESLLADVIPFIGVESMRVELGEDFTGDPSIWIVFRLRKDFRGDVPWVRAFAEHSTKLTIKLINGGVSRFPYTRIERSA